MVAHVPLEDIVMVRIHVGQPISDSASSHVLFPGTCGPVPTTVKAAQLVAFGKPGRFELREVPEPSAGPGEAVVRIQACGLNHLDLWLEENGLPIPISLPRTPGGEVAGQIVSLDSTVGGWTVGDRVAVQSNLFCGACEFCARGEESLCLHSQLLGVQRDGGFA